MSPLFAQTLQPSRSARVGFALLLAVLLLVAVGKAIVADNLDPDFFWHVKVAEQIEREGVHPLVDHLSFSSTREPWTPYSWLAELAMKSIWDVAGLNGVVIAQAVLLVTFFGFIAACCVEATRSRHGSPRWLASILATAFAGLLSLPYLSFRPLMFALVGLAAIAWLIWRDRRRSFGVDLEGVTPVTPVRTRDSTSLGGRGLPPSSSNTPGEPSQNTSSLPAYRKKGLIWMIPLLTALLFNLHLYAIVVPLWLAFITIGDAIDQRRLSKRYLLLTVCSAIALLATPLLPGVMTQALAYQSTDVMVNHGQIAEMRPMWSNPLGVILLLSLLTIFGVMARTRRTGDSKLLATTVAWMTPARDAWLVLWAAISILLMIRLGRFAPVGAIVFAPSLACISPKLRDAILERRPLQVASGCVLAIGLFRIGAALPAFCSSRDQWLMRFGPEAPAYPTVSALYVEEHVAPRSGRLINEFNWGGYLAWRLGDRYQVLLDGRTQLFSDAFWKATYLGTASTNEQILRSTNADAAILPATRSRFRASLESLGWRVVHSDEIAVVLVPPDTLIEADAR